MFWIRTDGTVSVSPGGEEQDVTSQWKRFAPMGKTTKEVRKDVEFGNISFTNLHLGYATARCFLLPSNLHIRWDWLKPCEFI